MLLVALIVVFLVIGAVAVVSFGITWLPVILAGALVAMIVWSIMRHSRINPNLMAASSNGRHLESARYADFNRKRLNYPEEEGQ